jgi:hypothetical protein
VMSSPVLPITVISASGAADLRPRRKRAAPTPPASTVMRIAKVGQASVPEVAAALPAAAAGTARSRAPRGGPASAASTRGPGQRGLYS